MPIPIHLENTRFPTVGPQALNLSTRGDIGPGDDALIGGFIVMGTESKKVALRVLGPSLSNSGVAGTLPDPVLTLYDSTGSVIATNDDWQSDPGAAAELTANGLAPSDPLGSGHDPDRGPWRLYSGVDGQRLGLRHWLGRSVRNLSPETPSKLANISTRGAIGTGDDVLIGGFIVGDVANATVVLRALGPSLAAFGISAPLLNPPLAIYDHNGTAIAFQQR